MNQSIFNWPNLITSLRAIVCLFCIIISHDVTDFWQILLFFMFVISFWPLDSLDGYVAKKLNQGSPFGAAYDLAVDRALDCVCAVAIVATNPDYMLISVLFLLLRIVPNCVAVEMDVPDASTFQQLRWRFINSYTTRLTAEAYQCVRAIFFGSVIFFGDDYHTSVIFIAMSLGYAIVLAVETKFYLYFMK
ncbi:CDP-alcohol phosphatidyltransferase family protein [Rhizobium rhizogenes]|uniref:CDP-alcohol phosphatidyltransferase family protein n=1 Tax=Rhizobium rhizogenes TaxID=359 RepID=UPI001571D878|nr:CDP-alcohol phosphatidyltransferase family protein [Rhizobium rhizogenes]NTI24879.1 CDP-alcohol phosphatidyltransferase family protein [Rhizobium rhizogenes]QTG08598.1 CDP-alcohol phosphatidyltransferase family protein [Rhizobium rhizogenes]